MSQDARRNARRGHGSRLPQRELEQESHGYATSRGGTLVWFSMRKQRRRIDAPLARIVTGPQNWRVI